MTLSPKQGYLLFAIIMVGTMTLVVTGLNTFVSTGFEFHPLIWLKNWLLVYAVALPVMIVFFTQSPRMDQHACNEINK